ncbi:hypothetical protein RJ640_002940 [Escallonia rubra]|uniref:Uncharacterized protein n=1 Tax=Escallonia rubra TaxID=112253 RepID=A0AA88UVY6_9ASTE|nr:hypothetical protein RJ640_002940 [Escallonia rubra]
MDEMSARDLDEHAAGVCYHLAQTILYPMANYGRLIAHIQVEAKKLVAGEKAYYETADKMKALLSPEAACMLRALPGLPEDLVLEMMEPPRRSYDPLLIQDPAIYRLNSAKSKTKAQRTGAGEVAVAIRGVRHDSVGWDGVGRQWVRVAAGGAATLQMELPVKITPLSGSRLKAYGEVMSMSMINRNVDSKRMQKISANVNATVAF